MGDRDRHFDQTKLFHQRPRKLIQFGHSRPAFAPGWTWLLKMNRKQRVKAKRGQR